MTILMRIFTFAFLLVSSVTLAQDSATRDAGDLSGVKAIAITRGLTETGRNCITCHRDINPGIVGDWKNSRHGHVGVSCVDCHAVSADSPTAIRHEDVFDMSDYDTSLLPDDMHFSVLVPPSTCARCHAAEHEQFASSGHFRNRLHAVPWHRDQAG